jgi:Flp pilus assembly protein TadG
VVRKGAVSRGSKGGWAAWWQHRAAEAGQALVEAALVIPVLVVLLSGVVMVGRIAHARLAVQAAAREASRALATAPSEQEGVTAAREAARSVTDDYGLSQDGLSVNVESNGFQRGGMADARVTYRVTLDDLPLLGPLEVTVTGSHSERIDLYRSREAASP